MSENRKAIIKLFEKGFSERKIANSLDLVQSTVHRIIARFTETGVNERKPGSGRPRTARTPANKRKIKGRIQRYKSNRKNFIRKMARAVGTSKSSIHRILHEELGANAWKDMKAHGLTDEEVYRRRRWPF
uniref:Transposase n=1 Tax=Acrobeloides nanus TaxID=290746 RepID=A0A914CJH4_9BILA